MQLYVWRDRVLLKEVRATLPHSIPHRRAPVAAARPPSKAAASPPAPSAAARQVLDRAKECGFTALALTADFSWVGNRERGASPARRLCACACAWPWALCILRTRHAPPLPA